MTDNEKLIWMFKEVHGDIDAKRGSCYTEVDLDDSDDPVGVSVLKDGNLCWHKSKLDIVFDYLTKHLD